MANLYKTTSQNLKSFSVYFYLRINGKNEYIFLIESDALDIDTKCISDLVCNIVKKINFKKINIKYEDNEFILSLKEYEKIDFYDNNYELRSWDKISHTPNYDCPCYSFTSMLDELIDEEFCFAVKNSSNIKFL